MKPEKPNWAERFCAKSRKINMSRIGKKTINLPEKVTLEVDDSLVTARGPKGELKHKLPRGLTILKQDNIINLVSAGNNKNKNALWGTTRSIIFNMITGVSQGYEKKLEIEGVGYKAQLQGDNLILNVGFSHPVEFKAPAGIDFKVEKNVISVLGIDKTLVGEVAAKIRKIKKPEPYKGKGIHYRGEVIRRKAGKKASASA